MRGSGVWIESSLEIAQHAVRNVELFGVNGSIGCFKDTPTKVGCTHRDLSQVVAAVEQMVDIVGVVHVREGWLRRAHWSLIGGRSHFFDGAHGLAKNVGAGADDKFPVGLEVLALQLEDVSQDR